ncbi:SDR family NAD(P)-dependent oxidoreductase [Methylocapsa acidiphila]|uniref:SDR family NAD(P)-dependent oxidoreductase n=1 Tax=Methylocapsa acidiphila TaxID=133552 RepID=UPI0003FFE2F1|nr:SDR family NAD(P)-dependent oxidoreductase [Methylocapsa acidiphila]
MRQRARFRATPKDGVAWVTGASAGIGRAVAIELARRGYRVAVTARRESELAALAAEYKNIFGFPGDIGERAPMAALVHEIEAAHGPIALAFLNAGVYFPAEAESFTAALAWRTFEVNVGGTLNCLDPLLAAMERRGRGQIAINASLAGYGGIPGSAAYGAAKAALIAMAEALKLTHDSTGVSFQIVNPGFVRTDMTAYATHFHMPFLMEAEQAARIICDGFERTGFEIAFPRRLAYAFKAARLLPYALFFPLMARATRRARPRRRVN